MTKELKIIVAPDPVLKAVAVPIYKIDDSTRAFVENMFTTMYAARGVGLAAPQVNVSQRVIVVDPIRDSDGTPPQPMALINPEIIWRSEELDVFEEGCLSLPEFYVDIERPASVRVKYTDIQNQDHEMLADGFLAKVLQHEIDHLNGVLLLDYISKLKRDMQIKRLIKMKKDEAL
jgi:peptide deformylase